MNDIRFVALISKDEIVYWDIRELKTHYIGLTHKNILPLFSAKDNPGALKNAHEWFKKIVSNLLVGECKVSKGRPWRVFDDLLDKKEKK